MNMKDIDLWEVNEAFSSVVLNFQKSLKISDDILNVNGGAIAMGHPLGATGAMLIGSGEYRFAPSDGDEFKGAFRAAMLRFDPADQPKLLSLENTKVTTDLAAHEMSRHLLDNVFRHCWHSGMKALIPDSGSWVANVYSSKHGDLLISTGLKSSVVHSFTAGETLYPKN